MYLKGHTMKDKFKEIIKFLKGTSVKQRIIAGVVLLTVVLGSSVIIYQTNKRDVAKSDNTEIKSKKLSEHLQADKAKKAEAEKAKVEAAKKAEADKQAKLKAEKEAKTKAETETETKAKAEAEKAQVVQAEQAKAQQEQQAQAVSEQTSTQATPQQSYQPSYVADNSEATPSYTAPNQGNTGTATTPTTPVTPTPTPSTPTVSDDQKWLNAGYIRAPFPEGSVELMNWLADNYPSSSGYTGNGEGWIRPY